MTTTEMGNMTSPRELVLSSLGDTDLCARTLNGHQQDAPMVAYAEYGVPWYSSACQTLSPRRDLGS